MPEDDLPVLMGGSFSSRRAMWSVGEAILSPEFADDFRKLGTDLDESPTVCLWLSFPFSPTTTEECSSLPLGSENGLTSV